MRLIRPSLVVAFLAVMSAASCTLITDVDRTEIPEKGSDGSGGDGGSGGEGTGGDGTGGTGGETAGGENAGGEDAGGQGGEAGAN
jgi:hypothetical protein